MFKYHSIDHSLSGIFFAKFNREGIRQIMKENKKGSHKKRKINVLQLVEGFSLGGAEKKLLELVKCMDRTSFNTTICSLGLGNEIQEEFENQVQLLEIHIA